MTLNNKFTHQARLLSSFMSTSNERLNNAIAGIQDNNKLKHTLKTEFNTNSEIIQARQNWLMSVLLDQIVQHQVITESYNNLFHGII